MPGMDADRNGIIDGDDFLLWNRPVKSAYEPDGASQHDDWRENNKIRRHQHDISFFRIRRISNYFCLAIVGFNLFIGSILVEPGL